MSSFCTFCTSAVSLSTCHCCSFVSCRVRCELLYRARKGLQTESSCCMEGWGGLYHELVIKVDVFLGPKYHQQRYNEPSLGG